MNIFRESEMFEEDTLGFSTFFILCKTAKVGQFVMCANFSSHFGLFSWKRAQNVYFCMHCKSAIKAHVFCTTQLKLYIFSYYTLCTPRHSWKQIKMLPFLLFFYKFFGLCPKFSRREMESYYIFTGFSAQILLFERATDGTIEQLLYHMFAETESHQKLLKLCKTRTITDCLA